MKRLKGLVLIALTIPIVAALVVLPLSDNLHEKLSDLLSKLSKILS